MITENDKKIKETNPKLYVNSLNEHYHFIDNLQNERNPKINKSTRLSNDQSELVFVVQQGSLNIRISGQDIKIKANDILLITPFTVFEILNSSCTFFSFAVTGYIAADMYNKMGKPLGLSVGCYTFHHYHLQTHQTKMLYQDYIRMKEVAYKNVPSLHEEMLKACLSIFMAHAFSFAAVAHQFTYMAETPSRQMFEQFLTDLSENYHKERFVEFYADKLGVQTKQLSAACRKYTNKTASRIINDYVIYCIKVVLYNNELNIKEVSEMFNFPIQSFFGRYFKRITGSSPSKYLNQYSKKLLKK